MRRSLCSPLVLCLLLFTGCSLLGGTHTPAPRATQTSGASGTGESSAVFIPGHMSTKTPPQGWQRILNGQTFTDQIGEHGLVASAARPGRLAGCALPASQPDDAPAHPIFALSDDAGRTWQPYTIPGAPTTRMCLVFADTQQPDTFAITLHEGDKPPTYITTNAGQTWRTLTPPPGDVMHDLINLTGGTVLATVSTPTFQNWHLAETILSPNGNSAWQMIDATLPDLYPAQYPGYLNAPQAIAVDPDNPAHIYVVMAAVAAAGDVLYATNDNGGSWQRLYQLPTANRIALWTRTPHRVYLEDLDDRAPTTYQLFYSADDGAHWQGIGLHTQQGEDIFISPHGSIITFMELDAATGTFFSLNPTTGVFTKRITSVILNGPFIGVIVDGPAPAFIYADQTNTYTLPLPPP
jgi:hypothetical protein